MQVVQAMLMRADGRSFLSGQFSGDLVYGGISLTAAGERDGFVMALDAEGSPMWSLQLPGLSFTEVQVRGLAFDPAEEALYVGADFAGAVTIDGQLLTAQGARDALFLKLFADGSLADVRQLGGSSASITITAATFNPLVPTPYYGGTFAGTGIGTTNGQLASAGSTDMCIVFPTLGSSMAGWSIGSAGPDRLEALATAPTESHHLVVAGAIAGTANSVLFNEPVMHDGPGTAAFLADFDSEGGLNWATKRGADGDTWMREVRATATDTSGIVIAGNYTGPVDFGSGPLPQGGGKDVFVARYDVLGSVVFARGFPAPLDQEVWTLALDENDNILLAGSFAGVLSVDDVTLTSQGGADVFLIKLDVLGNLLWARAFGGPGSQMARVVGSSPDTIFLSGGFEGTLDLGGPSVSSLGLEDLFVGALLRD